MQDSVCKSIILQETLRQELLKELALLNNCDIMLHNVYGFDLELCDTLCCEARYGVQLRYFDKVRRAAAVAQRARHYEYWDVAI